MIRRVAEGFYRGPRLLPTEYFQLIDLKIGAVLNLESDEDAVEKDRIECTKNNIAFFHRSMNEILPCSVKKLTDIVDLTEHLRKLYSVYVHCRRGIDRTGQDVAGWEVRYGGYSFEEAYDEQISLGHPELYNLLGWRWTLSRVKKFVI